MVKVMTRRQLKEAEYWRSIAQQLGLDYFVLARAARELIEHLPDGEYLGLGNLRAALAAKVTAAPLRNCDEDETIKQA